MATSFRIVEPPVYDPVLSGDQHSQAWTEYNQAVSDALGQIPVGVSDGSDAAAGNVGEYMTSTSGAATLASNTLTNLSAINLTPGDWDVSGYVLFQAGAGTHTFFAVGIIGLDARIYATFPTTAIDQLMPTINHRVSTSTATTVWVVAEAGFSGPMTATGTIQARRAR